MDEIKQMFLELKLDEKFEFSVWVSDQMEAILEKELNVANFLTDKP